VKLDEKGLKKHIKEGGFKKIYLLFGEETYLIAHYAAKIAESVTDGTLAEFNIRFLDGGECSVADIEDAVEALPVMSDRKCVVVQNMNISKLNAADHKRLLAIIDDIPEECVLVMRQDSTDAKDSKWKSFVAAAEKAGVQTKFSYKTMDELVRLLRGGVDKRGCALSDSDARLMIQRRGSDISLLLGEVEKLCAVASSSGGTITGEMIVALCPENMEASAYTLSTAILQGSYGRVYDIIHRLAACKAEPVVVLAALSGAFVDLYRAKVVAAAGGQARSLAADFNYRGREFRLDNAARDGGRLTVQSARLCLEAVADADRILKSSNMDQWIALEQTAARLILIIKTGVAV